MTSAMLCLFFLVSPLVNAKTCEKPGNTSGVMLLQRPVSHVERVEVDHGQYHVFTRHNVSEFPHVDDMSLIELAPSLATEHQSFFGEMSRRTEVLVSKSWSRWTPRRVPLHHHGPHHFWNSVVVFDWCLFASAIAVFFVLHLLVLGRMAQKGWHLAGVCIWLTVGASYNMSIWARFGSDVGMSWFAGYLLEFIFLVENIFIFHIIIDAFKTPVNLTIRALHIVVWGQIAFELVFFMGLAAWLRSFTALPYMLGVWLICCGILAARSDHSMNINLMESNACRAFTTCLGDRLSPNYEKDGGCMLVDKQTGQARVSLLGLVVFVLLAVDFLLEIDVVLTKIEEIPNPYIAFTSSAVAAFSIPDLFFVSKGLLHRFVMLKYGISFVLVLFGAQMLLSSIYILRPIVACCMIIGILVACIVSSIIHSYIYNGTPFPADCHDAPARSLLEVGNPREGRDDDHEADAPVEEADNLPEAQKTPSDTEDTDAVPVSSTEEFKRPLNESRGHLVHV